MHRLYLAAAMLAVAAAPAAAQVVSGTLLERGSDRPIGGATVELLSGSAVKVRARTDSAGAFGMDVPGPGTYRLAARRVGYQAATGELTVQRMDSLEVVFRLATDAVVLDPVQVTAVPRRLPPWLVGFYDRVESYHQGHFITREQVDSRRPFRTTDLLRTVPGLSLVPSRRGMGYVVRSRGGCEPMVFIDGLQVELQGNTIDELVQPRDVEGVEIYSGIGTTPAEFMRGRGATCGAIAFWTRLDR